MSEQPPNKSAREVWRSAVPSLLILVGTFFFINSACLRSDSRDDDYYEPPPCGGPNRTAPVGAATHILEPRPDQVFAGPFVDGGVEVPIRLGASGIDIAPRDLCRSDAAQLAFHIERVEGPCAGPQSFGPFVLSDGETETVQRLPAATYELHAWLVASNGHFYDPLIEASVRFVVEAPVQDGGCP